MSCSARCQSSTGPWLFRPGPAGGYRRATCSAGTGNLVVELGLPGIDPDKDVRVTVQDGTLCIRGERHRPDAEEDSYSRREWRYGAFERGFTLPEGTTGEDITASYRGGVLEVTVPKAAQRAEPRQIPVSTAGGKNGRTALAAPRGAA